jgi:hypothetical protein
VSLCCISPTFTRKLPQAIGRERVDQDGVGRASTTHYHCVEREAGIASTTDRANRLNRPVDTGAMIDVIDRSGKSPTKEEEGYEAAVRRSTGVNQRRYEELQECHRGHQILRDTRAGCYRRMTRRRRCAHYRNEVPNKKEVQASATKMRTWESVGFRNTANKSDENRQRTENRKSSRYRHQQQE